MDKYTMYLAYVSHLGFYCSLWHTASCLFIVILCSVMDSLLGITGNYMNKKRNLSDFQIADDT